MEIPFLTSKEIAEERLNICKACDEYALGVCKKCGCVMVAKTPLKFAGCPIGKWHPESPPPPPPEQQ
jgi:hypothetical protein